MCWIFYLNQYRQYSYNFGADMGDLRSVKRWRQILAKRPLILALENICSLVGQIWNMLRLVWCLVRLIWGLEALFVPKRASWEPEKGCWYLKIYVVCVSGLNRGTRLDTWQDSLGRGCNAKIACNLNIFVTYRPTRQGVVACLRLKNAKLTTGFEHSDRA